MSKYILITGQAKVLAQAEIWSVFHKQAKNLEFHDNYGLLDIDEEPAKIISRLGGTVKVAEYLTSFTDLSQLSPKWWAENLHLNKEHKANFGFSLYNSQSKKYLQIKKIALSVKKELKNQGYKARLVTSQELDLSSVVVEKNHLLNNELIIIHEDGQYTIGLTKNVQDFEDYAERDINRPERDDRSGMLPPKVAKMMINLLNAESKGTLLDPFCGSGTILQEAVLLGYKKIMGSDSSPKAIADSQKNLAWFRKQFNHGFEVKFIKTEAKNLNTYLPKESINYLVSEPFMGPATEVIKKNNLNYFYDLSQELSQLYLQSFKEFHKILKTQGKIIFVFPIFNIYDKQIPTIDLQQIEKIGFKNIKLPINKNGLIIYQRPGQKVARQITIWEKV